MREPPSILTATAFLFSFSVVSVAGVFYGERVSYTCHSFTKRSGTTNKGTDYELLNIAKITINLVKDDNIKQFSISSNDRDFGDFDDIVVEAGMEKSTEICALQLKHNNRSSLSQSQLTQARGDFSIKKYFASVQNIAVKAKFILWTNLKLDIAEGTIFYLQDEDFPVTLTKINPNDLFKISQKTEFCYKFSVVGDECSYEYCPEVLLFKRFFENFYLYSHQENRYNLKRSLTENFQTFFSGNEVECDQYIIFLNEWSLQEGTKDALNKNWIKLVVALKIISSRIKPLSLNNGIDYTEVGKRNILREALGLFDITFFEKKSYAELKKMWSDATCEVKDIKAINKLRIKYQIDSNYISDVAKADPLTLNIILWLMGKCPLILSQDATVNQVLELCVDKRIILLKDECVNSFGENLSVFETLSDLRTRTCQFNELVKNFTCSLQGKEQVHLHDLIKHNDEILTLVKTDDLLEMCKSRCIFGEAREVLQEPYIERCLLKNSIDIKILNNVSKETIVILDCVSQEEDLQNRFKRQNFININDCLNAEETEKSQMEFSRLNSCIYVSKERCKRDDFNAVCNKFQSVKNVHHFRVRYDGNLEWVRSKGDVNDVDKHKLSEYYRFHEREFSGFENNINLLVSDSGMGKSELMRSFKINCFSDHFTVIVDPKNVYAFMKTEPQPNYVDAFKKFLLDEKYKSFSDRDKAMFQIFLERNRVVYVWDALDELSNEHRTIVTDIIVELSKDCVQWATSRRHLQNTLQKKFNVLSLNLNKFDEEAQRDYIRKRLVDVSPTDEIEIIIAKIESSFALVEHKDILGIPLQVFMLTDLIRRNRDKYLALLSNVFLLTDLYKYFIEEKINIHYRDKHALDLNTAYAEQLIKSEKDKMFEEYSTAALKLLFPDEILTKLGVQNMQNFEQIHQSHTDIGLVTEVTDQIPRFLHNSFAEYLAALFFTNKLEPKEILAEVMFDPRYVNVRFFFDLLLTKGSRPHVAVLYRNFDFIKTCDGESLTSVDCGGRSALHLACSWGHSYPEKNIKCLENTHIIEDEGVFHPDPEPKEYLDALHCLLEKCEVSRSDQIHKLTAKEYALRTSCLAAEMQIMMKQIPESVETHHVLNMLYYSAYYGYCCQFSFCFELLFQKQSSSAQGMNTTECEPSRNQIANVTNSNGMTFLYIAATMGHIDIVEFLIKAGGDANLANNDCVTPLNASAGKGHLEIVKCLVQNGADINLANKDGFTPLNAASVKGYEEVVKFLVKEGATMNLANEDGVTPLNAAAWNGHYSIVENLVANDANINLPNKDGFTPLNVASGRGHTEIVRFLVENGADLNLTNKDGFTPLNAACVKGHDKIVRLLVETGAGINLANKDGVTPLHAATLNGHDDIVKFLVENSADPDLSNKAGFTPLNSACGKGHFEIAQLLIEAGGNINLANEDGFTPLNAASANGHYNIIKLLVDKRAELNLAGKDGFTPLNAASSKGYSNIAQFLVKAGADLNLQNEDGFTPLNSASGKGHYETVEVLVRAGADLNVPNKDGFTPLNAASRQGHTKVVEFLVERGADLNLPDKYGFTPLNAASEEGHHSIVEILAKRGADINCTNKCGFSPLNMASWKGHVKVVEFLVKQDADVNLSNEDGFTPLNTASFNGHHKIVEILLKTSADVNRANKNGCAPLNGAAWNGHHKVVDYLIRAGVNVNFADQNRVTPINAASWHGHYRIVESLVKAGADVHLAEEEDGDTPLKSASLRGHYRIVELLVKSGADINCKSKDGSTPLSAAFSKRHREIVEFLMREANFS